MQASPLKDDTSMCSIYRFSVGFSQINDHKSPARFLDLFVSFTVSYFLMYVDALRSIGGATNSNGQRARAPVRETESME